MESGFGKVKYSSEENLEAEGEFQRRGYGTGYGNGYRGMKKANYGKKCHFPGAGCLVIALAVVLAAVIVGGLVFGIWICVNKADSDPTTFDAWKVGFYGAVAAGGLVFIIAVIVYCVYKYQGRFGRNVGYFAPAY